MIKRECMKGKKANEPLVISGIIPAPKESAGTETQSLYLETVTTREGIESIIAQLKSNEMSAVVLDVFPERLKKIARSAGIQKKGKALLGTIGQLKKLHTLLTAREKELEQDVEKEKKDPGQKARQDSNEAKALPSSAIVKKECMKSSKNPMPFSEIQSLYSETVFARETIGKTIVTLQANHLSIALIKSFPERLKRLAEEQGLRKDKNGELFGNLETHLKPLYQLLIAREKELAQKMRERGKDPKKDVNSELKTSPSFFIVNNPPPQAMPFPAGLTTPSQKENKEKPKEKRPTPQAKEVEQDDSEIKTSPSSAVAKKEKGKDKQNPPRPKPLPARPKTPPQEENKEQELAALRQTIKKKDERIKVLEEDNRQKGHQGKIFQRQQEEAKTAHEQAQAQIAELEGQKAKAEQKGAERRERMGLLEKQLQQATNSSGQLRTALRRKDGSIQEMEKAISEKEKENANLKAQLSKLEETLRQERKKTEEKSRELIAEKQHSLSLEKESQQRDQALRQKEKQSEEQNERIEQHREDIVKQHEKIAQLEQVAQQIPQILYELKVLREDNGRKGVALACAHNELEGHSRALKETRALVATYQALNAQLQAQLQIQSQELQHLRQPHGNRSWEDKVNANRGGGRRERQPHAARNRNRQGQNHNYSERPDRQRGASSHRSMGDTFPRSILKELGEDPSSSVLR